MVGQKYKHPSAPVPQAFKEQPPDSFKESDGWKRAQPADQVLRGKSWELFGDSTLNELEEQVTISNQALKAAEARFREARPLIPFNRAAPFPTITVRTDLTPVRASPP